MMWWERIPEQEESDEKKIWVQNSIRRYNCRRAPPVLVLMLLLLLPLYILTVTESSLALRISVMDTVISCSLSMAFMLQRRLAIALYATSSLLLVVLSIIGAIPVIYLVSLLSVNWGSMIISQKITKCHIRDAEKDYETVARLNNEAQTDNLTGILNRNGLEKQIETALAFCKRAERLIGFLMIDIDDFKIYNDTRGHWEGDYILKNIADCIKACFKRKTDIVGRIGGDEFLICITDFNEKNILEMAQTLSCRITGLKIESQAANESSKFLTVSIGIAICFPKDHGTIQDLYIEADRALYHAKSNGRNCISFNGQIIQGDGVSLLIK